MKLEDFRKQLDTIDDQILALLNQRIDVVEQVGDLKREQSQSHKKELQVYAPHREKQILARLHQKNHHLYYNHHCSNLKRIYGRIELFRLLSSS